MANVVGERLRQARKKNRLTQKRLADLMQMSDSAVGMYEAGNHRPSIELLKQFADVLHVDFAWLAGKEAGSIKVDYKESLPDNPVELTDAQWMILRKGFDNLADPIKKQVYSLMKESVKVAILQEALAQMTK